ncbi:hypothetical protein B0H16DRAFT_1846483 [Mycena metata]|uniref:F-box domain-containing protein n=1 Tax=Mycena metata TaxID=1033252 RepID=A0AAD7K4I6_9AGAR|nr:hypothetical protein B0H16DRAFT_1846483 [Mycena metata]
MENDCRRADLGSTTTQLSRVFQLSSIYPRRTSGPDRASFQRTRRLGQRWLSQVFLYQSQRSAVTSMAKKASAVLLPTEILAEIFAICLPAPDNINEETMIEHPRRLRRLLPTEMPLVVASVCRRWRDAALSTPHLWVFLDLRDFNLAKKNPNGVVSSWLLRSVPYPLSFAAAPSSRAVLKEVMSQCERWNTVELVVNKGNSFQEVRGRLPCLTKIHLTVLNPHPYNSFADAPRLTHVSLLAHDLISIILPWHQLTNLVCEGFTDVACVKTLQQCPALIECHFIGRNKPRSMKEILSYSRVVHQCLNSFQLDGTSALDTLRLLESPSLRVLKFSIENFSQDPQILPSFLTRSRCHLETLCVRQIDSTDLFRCLQPLSSLVTLEITTSRRFITDEFLRWFTHDSTVLPNLQKLVLDLDLTAWWNSPDWDHSLLQEMVLSRCLASGISRDVRLQTFRLLYTPNRNGGSDRLVELATELAPLLEPHMAEFTISCKSRQSRVL